MRGLSLAGKVAIALSGVLVAAGCASAPRLLAEQPQDVNWRKVATPHDRARLRDWREAWIAARALVEQAGAGTELARQPLLLDPDRTLAGGELPQGVYRCRSTRLGGRDAAAPAILTEEWAACRVGHDGQVTTFAIDGANRVNGTLFDDTDARSVFLGTLAIGDETRSMRYGRDPRRDMAGLIERIGERRWRLVLPYPAFASTLDVIEILPAG